MKDTIPVDLDGKVLSPGDKVIMVRPVTWRGAGGLCRATIVKFHEKSQQITVEVEDEKFSHYDTATGGAVREKYMKKFSTPYRSSKFFKEN